MIAIYACLAGKWVNLESDPNCKMGKDLVSPQLWWEQEATIYSPSERKENTLYTQDHVIIYYLQKEYRIHPVFIQIIES